MTSTSKELPNENKSQEGGWIGIDLGTSNCTAAVWDLSRSRCKVLRLGHQDLARPPADDSSSRKGGKIVPSAVLFHDCTEDRTNEISGHSIPGVSSLAVGYAAVQSPCNSNDVNDDGNHPDNQSRSRALVTSFKRVVGMTSRQALELKSSDPEFWNSLPFQAVILDTHRDNDVKNEEHMRQKQNHSSDHLDGKVFDVLGDAMTYASHLEPSINQMQQDVIKEGVAIKIQPLNSSSHPSDNTSHEQPEHLVTPLQVTTILLQSIRVAATEYLTNNNKSKIQAPGLEDTSNIQNCIIGVPAHYSQAQRTAIKNAAINAGFAGHVGVMTESTAASMAYGLFVSPVPKQINSINPSPNLSPTLTGGGFPADENTGGKNILVFDMGGGTTDVTIASIDFGKSDKVQFLVIATAGDQCLGGDDVDELLARFLFKQQTQSSLAPPWKASEHQDFIRQCRRAKEKLCGNDEDDSNMVTGMTETNVILGGETIRITRQEFDSAIQTLIDRAEHVVDDALSALESDHHPSIVHEVVLVGGSTHIPTIRSMLRRKFPPPVPPDLCTSISAETAVAQGLAIQAALVSGTVPLWELRNAMMLDVLPHSIGVWVGGIDCDSGGVRNEKQFTKGQIIQPRNDRRHHGHFLQILRKDSPLPAMGNANFNLASKDQSGVTVIAVEHIGPGEIYQCMGVFDFLLHRIRKTDDSGDQEARKVKIGMSLETSGKFVVSIFDESDPEHREKRRRYLKEKSLHDKDNDGNISEDEMECFYEHEEKRQACTGTEMGLIFFCVILFALYVAARISFSNAELELSHLNDEL
ncbi:hypothetical protein ACHAXR_003814 [Thalassiosira sp. AJA248-18]